MNMNISKFTLKQTRNGAGKLVLTLFADDKIIFATSNYFQLGYALHALGITMPARDSSDRGWCDWLFDPTGGVLHSPQRHSADERLFWAAAMLALWMKERNPNARDIEYNFIATVLPGELVKVPHRSFLQGTPRELDEIERHVLFPCVSDLMK